MFKVNAFLYCIPLRIFGLLLGWLMLILSALLAVLCVLLSGYLLFEPHVDRFYHAGYAALSVVLFVLVALSAKRFIIGVNERDCAKMTLFRGFLYLCFIVGFFQIITILYIARSTEHLIIFIAPYAVFLCCQFYIICCIDSLHDQIHDEKCTTRYQSTATQVNKQEVSYELPK